MSSEKKTISIIIPAKNEAIHIHKCLKSVVNLDYPSDLFEIIVVDNGSTDETIEIAKTFEKVKIIKAPELKVGAVRNIGALHAKNEILVFLDADCVVDNDWLNKISAKINIGSVVGGGIILPEHPTYIEKHWLLEGPYGHSLPKELIGATLAIYAKDFKSIDGFDEKMTSGEDSDLSLKLRKKKFNINISRDFSVVHLGNAKTTKAFIKRQIWHSENYAFNLKNKIKDPVFILTIAFSVSLYHQVISIFHKDFAATSLVVALLCIIMLSVKRLIRTGHILKKKVDIIVILYIDFLYLLGRTLGLHRSIIKRILSVKN